MKKIVKGNDFTLKIPVMKSVEGQKVPFPLPACTDVQVRVCNQFKRISLSYEVDVENDNVINHLRKAIGNILEDKDIMECLEKDITQGMDEWFAFFFVALSAGPLSEDVDVEKVLQGLKLKLGNNNQ